ncbi:unnamed protein product [Adineta ricciae]|uniref:F-box domain-containing protein n=1 Tax=Adineta ricciae TaxID=249248 RepID=A0A813QI10_ADIRI|nr:unnamed protein product [Adineta ricciae]
MLEISARKHLSLITLPTEILHHIFDSIDCQTILLSIRQVCSTLCNVTNTYERYQLDFRSISLDNYRCLISRFDPGYVHSIVLSNDFKTPNQIQLFLSNFNTQKFVQLRSLTLLEIEDETLAQLLQTILHCSLKFLSIKWTPSSTPRYQTLTLISTVVTHNSLSKLSMHHYPVDTICKQFSIQCKVHLTLSEYTYSQLCELPLLFPYLEELKLDRYSARPDEQLILQSQLTLIFQYLTSLTLRIDDSQWKQLREALLTTPSLLQLSLQVFGILPNSDTLQCPWEELIQTNLPRLTQIDFLFVILSENIDPNEYIESLLLPFRTPFWTEVKRWFVTGDFYSFPREAVRLYTVSFHNDLFQYPQWFSRVWQSISPIPINDTEIMSRIHSLTLNMNQVVNYFESYQIDLPDGYLLPNVTELQLTERHQWLPNSIEILSKVINLTRINDLLLTIGIDRGSTSFKITNLIRLLERTINLRSLDIDISRNYPNDVWIIAESDLFSLIPHSIQHLQIPPLINEFVKKILTELSRLQSVTFKDWTNFPIEMVSDYLGSLNKPFTYQKRNHHESYRTDWQLWLSTRRKISSEILSHLSNNKYSNRLF